MECEARSLLTRPKEERTARYLAVAKSRGQTAADSLRAAVELEYRKRG